MPRLRRQNGNNVDPHQIFFQEPSELGLHHLPFRTKSGLNYYIVPICFRKWSLRSHSVQSLVSVTPTLFPCVSGSGVWDLIPYRIWAVLLLRCSHVFQEVECEISFHTESGLYYYYILPMCFRKWIVRSHTVQSVVCITPTLLPCVSGSGAWDLIPYRVWSVLLLHYPHVFQEVEHEISFRTESGLYYSYVVPIGLRKWSGRSHSVQNLGCITPTLFPCTSGSRAWDLIWYRIWVVLLLRCSHVFQEMEREISFLTESGLYYSYVVPMYFRKWSVRSLSIQSLGCIIPTLFPCVSGSGACDLIPYRVWSVLLLRCSHVFQEVECEISFPIESGLYYSCVVPLCFRKWSVRSFRTSVPFGTYLGPKFGPIHNAKKYPLFPIWKFWKSDWNFLKETLKTEHFFNIFRPRMRSECFP